jgi:hypothetical protein
VIGQLGHAPCSRAQSSNRCRLCAKRGSAGGEPIAPDTVCRRQPGQEVEAISLRLENPSARRRATGGQRRRASAAAEARDDGYVCSRQRELILLDTTVRTSWPWSGPASPSAGRCTTQLLTGEYRAVDDARRRDRNPPVPYPYRLSGISRRAAARRAQALKPDRDRTADPASLMVPRVAVPGTGAEVVKVSTIQRYATCCMGTLL